MATSEQTALALKKLGDALSTLAEQAAEPESRMARDSLLLRYVDSFEMCWQCMHQIVCERGATETPRVAFAVLEVAFKLGWLGDAGLWKRMRDARNGVSHSYDEALAVQLAAFVRQLALPELTRVFDVLKAKA
jgi:nucleotidyltransferase substrate binding protein (TIGR01987 family)